MVEATKSASCISLSHSTSSTAFPFSFFVQSFLSILFGLCFITLLATARMLGVER